MRKKLWSVILTAAIAVGTLAGCGQTGTIAATDTTQKADTATEAATDTEADPAYAQRFCRLQAEDPYGKRGDQCGALCGTLSKGAPG